MDIAQTQTSESPNTTILVTNISPSANEKNVSEFFSFCGTIVQINLNTYPNRGSEAIVRFETEAAAKTALLLTNALIADRAITVVPFAGTAQQSFYDNQQNDLKSTHELKGSEIPNKEHVLPAEQRSKTSVVASMLAAGYNLGTDAITRAKDVDEQNQLSVKAAAAAAAAKEKMLEIDRQLHISETFDKAQTAVVTKAKEIDESWKISDNVNAALKSVSDNFEHMKQQANANPTVQATVSTVSQWGTNVANAVAPATTAIKQNVDQIKTETNREIEIKEREKAAKVAAAPPPPIPPHPASDATTPTPDPQ
jgi:RNA recognition motif-containing protein